MLPKHGKIECRSCFADSSAVCEPHPDWRMVNDPGAWGSERPRYLVLGFSKGATQAGIYRNGRFEEIAFAGMRARLTSALQAMNVLDDSDTVDRLIADPSGEFAFGSLVRCSVSRLDDKASRKKGKPVYGCTGPLVTRSFREIPGVIDRCASRFLRHLPDSVQCVFFLGNSDSYVKYCQALVKRLFPEGFMRINPMGVIADDRGWIHLAHPSGLNGHFNSWLEDETGSGEKRRLALDALKQINE